MLSEAAQVMGQALIMHWSVKKINHHDIHEKAFALFCYHGSRHITGRPATQGGTTAIS
jgi:hypothetical protein